MALHEVQRLLQSSESLGSKLEGLQSCMAALQAPKSRAAYPNRVMTQVNFVAMSFCSRTLCNAQDSMTGAYSSQLWQLLRQAAMNEQVRASTAN
jgi:hypothetical protein